MCSLSVFLFGLSIICLSIRVEGMGYGPRPPPAKIIHAPPPVFVEEPFFKKGPDFIPFHPPVVKELPPVHIGYGPKEFYGGFEAKVEVIKKDDGKKGDGKKNDRGDFLKIFDKGGSYHGGNYGGGKYGGGGGKYGGGKYGGRGGKKKVIEEVGDPVDGGTVVINLERKGFGGKGRRDHYGKGKGDYYGGSSGFDLHKFLGTGPTRGDISKFGGKYDGYPDKYRPYIVPAYPKGFGGGINPGAFAAGEAAANIARAHRQADFVSAKAHANVAAAKAAIHAANQGVLGGLEIKNVDAVRPAPLPAVGFDGGFGGGVSKFPLDKGPSFPVGPIPDGVVPIFPEYPVNPPLQKDFQLSPLPLNKGFDAGGGNFGSAGFVDNFGPVSNGFGLNNGDGFGINKGDGFGLNKGDGFGLIGGNAGFGGQAPILNPNTVDVGFATRFEAKNNIGPGFAVNNNIGVAPKLPVLENFGSFPKAALFDGSATDVKRDKVPVAGATLLPATSVDPAPPLTETVVKTQEIILPPPIETKDTGVTLTKLDITVANAKDGTADIVATEPIADIKNDVVGLVN